MGFQIKTLTENDRFFVVDIGTSRIKVLLCELDSGILKILEHTSIRQSRKHMQGGNIADLQGVSESLRKSISKLESAVEGEVRDIIFSLQSPSLVTDTLSMNYVRDSEQQALTMEEIDSMVAKIEQKSLEKAKPKIISQNVEDDVQMKLVTTTLTSIVIDGKKVSNPIGFTGKNVSLTVCNIFLPIASFHVYASIARDVDKRLISFVPTPITLPKAQSESLELFDPNCFIDIGAALTTITLENFSEILGALQIPIGIGLYENMMMRKFPKLSRLEIEHIIQSHGDTPAITDEIRIGARAIRIEFLELLTNAVQVWLRMISPSFLLRNVYLSWACTTPEFLQEFQTALAALLSGSPIQAHPLIPKEIGLSPEYGVAYALAKTAEELVRQQSDPIARILRYVIYRYE